MNLLTGILWAMVVALLLSTAVVYNQRSISDDPLNVYGLVCTVLVLLFVAYSLFYGQNKLSRLVKLVLLFLVTVYFLVHGSYVIMSIQKLSSYSGDNVMVKKMVETLNQLHYPLAICCIVVGIMTGLMVLKKIRSRISA